MLGRLVGRLNELQKPMAQTPKSVARQLVARKSKQLHELHTIVRHIHAIPGLYISSSSPHIESYMVHAKTRTDILATNTN